MKAALLLSGHMRTYIKCAASQLNLVKHLDTDIFISTWDMLGFGSLKYNKYPNLEQPVHEQQIRDVYGQSVKAVKIEHQASYCFNRTRSINSYSKQPNGLYKSYKTRKPFMPRIISMWYKVQDVFKMCLTSGKKYEIVIRCRPDLQFFDVLPSVNLTENTVYMASSEMYGGWNDQFAFGNINVMEYYCNIYDFIDQYASENHNIPCYAEVLVDRHLRGISVQKTPLHYIRKKV